VDLYVDLESGPRFLLKTLYHAVLLLNIYLESGPRKWT